MGPGTDRAGDEAEISRSVIRTVRAHYATVRFSLKFILEVRTHIAGVVEEQDAAERLPHKQLTGELEALDTREDNLIEPAAAATIQQPKIKAGLREWPATAGA
jgi:hypothetical protein